MDGFASLTPQEWQAVRLSFVVATRSVVVSLPFAVLVAWLLARGRFFGRSWLDAFVHLPLVLPPVVTGWLLLLLFGVRGPLGALLQDWFGVRLVFTANGAALATAVMSFPLLVRAIRLSLESIDTGFEAAARTLGARPLDRFFTITLPLMAPGILAGTVTAFAAGLGEFGAVITFASNVQGETQTLPLAIYSATQTPGGEATAAKLSLISFVLAVTALLLADRLSRRVQRWIGRAGVSFSVSLQHRFADFALDATFDAPTPGVTVLFGPSGSGKSTVLACIAGLLRADQGRIALDETICSTGRATSTLRPKRGAPQSCSRTRACSRICRCGTIFSTGIAGRMETGSHSMR